MNVVALKAGGDAAEIGRLYGLSKSNFVESMRYYCECGERLQAKKQSLPFGEWEDWLAINRPALGFGGTAAKAMMRASKRQSTVDLTETEALAASRALWGNDKPSVSRADSRADDDADDSEQQEYVGDESESVNAIHRKFDEAIQADIRAHKARVSAGQMLNSLQAKIGAGWWPWYEARFVRSKRDAMKVMKIANDEASQ
jgi:hypothetical protein